MVKKMRKTVVQEDKSCSVQKTAKKKTPNIREMRPFFKVGHIAKAIAHDFAKCSVWVEN